MSKAQIIKRSVEHGDFTIERELAFPPARVFAAWADPKAKAQWFAGPADKWKLLEREMEFRVGGRERGTRALLDNLDKELQRP